MDIENNETQAFNVFQIYTNDGVTILPSKNVEENLNILDTILTDNIDKLKFLNSDEEISDENYKELYDYFTFNGIDLTPSDALRGSLNSFFYTNSDDIRVEMPITYSNQFAQFMDFLSQDTGRRNLSSYFTDQEFQELFNNISEDVAAGINNETKMDVVNEETLEDDIDEKVSFLYENINFYVKELTEKKTSNEPIEPKIFGYLFKCIVMFFEEFDKLHSSVSTIYNDEYINRYYNYVIIYVILLHRFPVLMTSSLSTKLQFQDELFAKIHDTLFTTLTENTDIAIDSLDGLLENIISRTTESEDAQKILYYKLLIDSYNFTTPTAFETSEMEIIDDEMLNSQFQDTNTPVYNQQPIIRQQQPIIRQQQRFGMRKDQLAKFRQPQRRETRKDQLAKFRQQEQREMREERVTNARTISGYYGGSCERINLRNQLLSVKLSFEWQHDFGPGTERAPKYTSGDYQYPQFYASNNIFTTIEEGWKIIINQFKNTITERETNILDPDIVDKTIFDKLTQPGKHDEPRYMADIVDSLMEHCQNMKENFMYTPIAEFKFKPQESNNMTTFFDKVFQYYGNQRMFIKPEDSLDTVVHLSITSDNTPIDNLNTGKPLGTILQDMKSIGGLEIALATYRAELYTEWDKVLQENNKVEYIFDAFKNTTSTIIDNAKNPEDDIKTPANLIDPITTGGFDSVNYPRETDASNKVIKQKSELFNQNDIFQNTIKLATIYGMNQLLYFWINNKHSVSDYVLSGSSGEKVDTIKFILDNQSFEWSVGDSTINTICGSLINVFKNISNKAKSKDSINFSEIMKPDYIIPNEEFVTIARKSDQTCYERWSRLYKITNTIMEHGNFRYEKTIQNFMVILSYLKSCGDEFQRITCEFINYAMYLPKRPDGEEIKNDDNTQEQEIKNYVLEYLPSGTKLPFGTDIKSIFQNVLYLLTQDRILVGESIEKDTPVFTSLKCPNDAFYDDPKESVEFISMQTNVKGENISRTTSGILSNRRNQISEAATIDYAKEMGKNKKMIDDLYAEIILKMRGEQKFKEEEIKILTSVDSSQEETAKEIITQQKTLIGKLSKTSLALTYYDVKDTSDMYEILIEGEIHKAVSLTIDSKLLDTILLQNSCRVPKTIKALKTLISNMYNEPETVDKLIDSYETACNLLKKKLTTYKEIVQKIEQNKEIAQNLDLKPVITKYDKYILGITNKETSFSDQIITKVTGLLQSEMKKLGNMVTSITGRRTKPVQKETSNSNTPVETGEIKKLEKELNKLQKERENLTKEESIIKKQEEETKNISVKQTKKLLASLIKPFTKRTKEIAKELSSLSGSIQNVMNKKNKIEAKLVGKTKIFGLETYQNIVKTLKQRTSKVVPIGGGKKHTKKNHVVYKNKQTKNRYKCCKYKSKKRLKRRNARKTRNKK